VYTISIIIECRKRKKGRQKQKKLPHTLHLSGVVRQLAYGTRKSAGGGDLFILSFFKFRNPAFNQVFNCWYWLETQDKGKKKGGNRVFQGQSGQKGVERKKVQGLPDDNTDPIKDNRSNYYYPEN